MDSLRSMGSVILAGIMAMSLSFLSSNKDSQASLDKNRFVVIDTEDGSNLLDERLGQLEKAMADRNGQIESHVSLLTEAVQKLSKVNDKQIDELRQSVVKLASYKPEPKQEDPKPLENAENFDSLSARVAELEKKVADLEKFKLESTDKQVVRDRQVSSGGRIDWNYKPVVSSTTYSTQSGGSTGTVTYRPYSVPTVVDVPIYSYSSPNACNTDPVTGGSSMSAANPANDLPRPTALRSRRKWIGGKMWILRRTYRLACLLFGWHTVRQVRKARSAVCDFRVNLQSCNDSLRVPDE